LLGNREAVDKWLKDHVKDFSNLSKERLQSGEQYREEVIRHNMVELIDLLAAHPDILPCAAAEQISIQRLTARESEQTAEDIMVPIPIINIKSSLQEAAALIIKEMSGIIAVISNDNLVGVITDWDITKAAAEGVCDISIDKIMTKDVITASANLTISDIVREFEQYQISAMPVVQEGRVLGKVSTDLIAKRYVLNFLNKR